MTTRGIWRRWRWRRLHNLTMKIVNNLLKLRHLQRRHTVQCYARVPGAWCVVITGNSWILSDIYFLFDCVQQSWLGPAVTHYVCPMMSDRVTKSNVSAV